MCIQVFKFSIKAKSDRFRQFQLTVGRFLDYRLGVYWSIATKLRIIACVETSDADPVNFFPDRDPRIRFQKSGSGRPQKGRIRVTQKGRIRIRNTGRNSDTSKKKWTTFSKSFLFSLFISIFPECTNKIDKWWSCVVILLKHIKTGEILRCSAYKSIQ